MIAVAIDALPAGEASANANLASEPVEELAFALAIEKQTEAKN